MEKETAQDVLLKALNDICPLEIPDDEDFAYERIKNRNANMILVEQKLDKEWTDLEQEYEDYLEQHETEKKRVIAKLKENKTAEALKDQKRRFDLELDSKITRLDSKFAKDYQFYILKYRDNKPKLLEKIKYLENKQDSQILEVKTRYESLNKRLNDTKEYRISQTNKKLARMDSELKEKFDYKVLCFNHKSITQDQVRHALAWFKNDVENVKFWCDQADIPIDKIYREAIRRLDLLGREDQEFVSHAAFICENGYKVNPTLTIRKIESLRKEDLDMEEGVDETNSV